MTSKELKAQSIVMPFLSAEDACYPADIATENILKTIIEFHCAETVIPEKNKKEYWGLPSELNHVKILVWRNLNKPE